MVLEGSVEHLLVSSCLNPKRAQHEIYMFDCLGAKTP